MGQVKQFRLSGIGEELENWQFRYSLQCSDSADWNPDLNNGTRDICANQVPDKDAMLVLRRAKSASASRKAEIKHYIDIDAQWRDVPSNSRPQASVCVPDPVENGCVAHTSHVTRGVTVRRSESRIFSGDD